MPCPRRSSPLVVALVVSCAACTLAPPASAATCSVPGTHPTLGAALGSPACDEVQLAEATYRESPRITRSVVLRGALGAPATVAGRLRAVGAGVAVSLADLVVDPAAAELGGCFPAAVAALDGARIVGERLVVRNQPGAVCRLVFEDDHESGDASRWSASSGLAP